MKNLDPEWPTIDAWLRKIPGFDPKAVQPFFQEGQVKRGIHFFLVEYEPGEIIMAKDTTSDFAALHVQGGVRVLDVAPRKDRFQRGCWSNPQLRRLENIVIGKPGDAKPAPRWTFLGPLYRSLPSLPLGLARWADFWFSQTAGDRVRGHIRSVFGGEPLGVPRLERDLSKPKETERVDSESGVVITIRDKDGNERPAVDRFMGITGALWNQPRSVTLAAANDNGQKCQMLLIKRKAFLEIINKCPSFYERKMVEFVDQTLPSMLAKNRLFRERIFFGDVLDWAKFLSLLQGKAPGPLSAMVRGVPEKIEPAARAWIDKTTYKTLRPEEKLSLLRAANQLLTRRDLVTVAMLPEINADVPDELLLDNARKNLAGLNDIEISRLNRLALESAIPGGLASAPTPSPMTPAQLKAFTRALATRHQAKFGAPLQPYRPETTVKEGNKNVTVTKGLPIVKQGDPADAVYLILSGMVRVHMETPGGRTMINNLEANAFFGEAAILETPADGKLPTRKATVETLCATNLVKLDRDVLLAVLAEDSPDAVIKDSNEMVTRHNFASLAEKLRQEHASYKLQDEQVSAGRIVPPHDPPQAIAQQLVLTRNILLIDMNKCTRCDQCVRGCSEAHEFTPRFHRANPKMRFGHWEVAGACLNCVDAPCQQVCPVGAITLLNDQSVQIHRDRCISCDNCAKECPFDVIDMAPPVSALDAPSMSPKKGTVATKCDLCLTENHDPPCVASCPYDAAQRVDPLTFFPELREWANIAHR